MKAKKSFFTAAGIMGAGLLLVLSSTFIHYYAHTPDFLRGLLTGTGIGLGIVGIVWLKKARVPARGTFFKR